MLRTNACFALLLVATSAVGADDYPLKGRLVALQAGDAACYADIENEGKVQNLMAGFHVCEQQALIGKQVRLGWSEVNVLAADCEGDVDCGRSDSVLVIDRIIAEPARAACGAGEQTAFTCLIGQERVAVCYVAANPGAWLQYRFGTPRGGAELLVPAAPIQPALAAEGRVDGGGASWLRFRNAGHAYVVYSGIGRRGQGGASARQSGVVIERGGKPIASLTCDDDVQSELDAAWYTRLGVNAPATGGFVIPGDAK